MKKILVIYYSQTGQTETAVKSILSTMTKTIKIDFQRIMPEKDYPFPWEVDSFLEVMPESVLEKPISVKPLLGIEEKYDLIILGYQPWFLSISLPMLSFLQSEQAKNLLKGQPVLTIITCRNMWVNAQGCMKEHLDVFDATLVGNIVLDDKHSNAVSFITVVRWLICGNKKGNFLLPAAGVSDKSINEACRFGPVIEEYLESCNLQLLDNALQDLGSIPNRPELALYEKNAYKRFRVFAKFLSREEKGLPRQKKLRIFMYALFLVSIITFPIVALIEIVMNLKRKIWPRTRIIPSRKRNILK